MTKKESKFIPINLPKYLVEDIDTLLIKKNIKSSRASFIVGILNNHLDEEFYNIETERKNKALSLRAQRHCAREALCSASLEAEEAILNDIKKITKLIETGKTKGVKKFYEKIYP